MYREQIEALLSEVAAGTRPVGEALAALEHLPFDQLGFATIDVHRPLRLGYPETIYCAGKTGEQVAAIAERMAGHGANFLGTRCDAPTFELVKARVPSAVYVPAARAFTVLAQPPKPLPGYVALVCAGTSDLHAAEEAATTFSVLGVQVERVYDVGVAGLHRLLAHLETLRKARVCIVCAGMEGALPSVMAGLVPVPIIGVPTSVGYGAALGGFTALMGMLTSCANGLTVVNIDNGYGAAIAAYTMCRTLGETETSCE